MRILYRISDAGYNKVKPSYINNENCLKNFCNVFFHHIHDINMIKKYIDPIAIEEVSVGHGAGTFNLALNKALNWSDEEVVYFVENDYLHTQAAPSVLTEVFKEISPDYATLYDHPDKYIPANRGGNPYIDEDGGELTKLYLAGGCHWKLTNSTTMTFAARVKTLRQDEPTLRKWTNQTHPNDFQMFLELREKGRTLLSSVPGHSTHGETAWLTPLVSWQDQI